MAKVMGSLAMQKPQEGVRVGIFGIRGVYFFRILGGGNEKLDIKRGAYKK